MLCLLNHFPHIFHAGAYGTECMKWTLYFVGNDIGNSSFANAGRSPQDHGWNVPGGYRFADDSVRTEEMLLSDQVFELRRTHAFCKRGGRKIQESHQIIISTASALIPKPTKARIENRNTNIENFRIVLPQLCPYIRFIANNR